MIEDLIIYTPMFVGLFWAIIFLFFNWERSPSKILLGIFMTVIFLHYTTHILLHHNPAQTLHILDPIFNLTSLSIYPLLFWYIKMLTKESGFRWKNLILFIPAVTLAIASFSVYQFIDSRERMVYFDEFIMKNDSGTPFSTAMKTEKYIFITSRLIFFIQVIFIAIIGIKLVKQFNQQIEEFYSNTERKSINWANFIIYALVISMIISVPVNLLGRGFFVNYPLLLVIPNLGIGILVFLFGIYGYHQIYTIRDFEIESTPNRDEILPQNLNKQKLKEKLLELFVAEALYKTPDLKITHVSEKLHTNRTYISKLINTEFKCTFSEFVNRYRVEEAKQLLCEEKSKGYSLDYIAEKSGFGSMVNFMRVFREIEGITPGRFRETKG